MAELANIKPWIVALVGGIILLIVGAVTGTITIAVGNYMVNTLNSTGSLTISNNQNFVNSIATTVAPVFTILGTALIIVALVFIIRQLLGITEIAGE